MYNTFTYTYKNAFFVPSGVVSVPVYLYIAPRAPVWAICSDRDCVASSAPAEHVRQAAHAAARAREAQSNAAAQCTRLA